MRMIYILPLICLTACGTLKTTDDKYYALNVAITEVGNIAEKYVDVCIKELPPEDKCHQRLPRVHGAALRLQEASQQLDKVFVSKDSQFYNLSLTVTQNAINHMKLVLGE